MMQADVENFSSVAGSVLCGQSLDSLEVLPLPLQSLPLPCKDKLLLIPAKPSFAAWTEPAIAGTSCSGQMCGSPQHLPQYCQQLARSVISLTHNDPEARTSSSLINLTSREDDDDAFSSWTAASTASAVIIPSWMILLDTSSCTRRRPARR